MKHIKTFESFINEGEVSKPIGKKIWNILTKAERGYSLQATVDDILKLDSEFSGFENEVWDIVDDFKKRQSGIQAAYDSILSTIEGADESLAPVSEGNKFRYDYQGWQQVYQAYYEKTGTHKSVTDEPLKFIDWLAKNTTPPTDFK